jgi:5-methylcytosine-specific restriction endonuclease McrA
MCELASGKYVTPGTAARWLGGAVLEQLTFDGRNRVLSVSRRRAFTGAVRRAVEVRDRTCSHRYCNRPPDESEVDHVVPYARGGLTSQENGKLYCWFHNRLREPEHIRKRRTRPPSKSKQERRRRPKRGRVSANQPDE